MDDSELSPAAAGQEEALPTEEDDRDVSERWQSEPGEAEIVEA